MIWHILKYWTSFLFPTFYKRIQSHNMRHLMTNDPVIIAMNHPNAFTDPSAFTYVSYPLRLYYMARGDAFKPGIISWLLEQIGIVPIFRIQDAGKEGLAKNDEAYRRVNKLLEKNGKVMVFAEGLCVQERRLRPIKKGVVRMVFGAYEHLGNDRLKVVPVGVNYSRAHKFRSKLLYNIGEPISVKDYYEAYKANPAKTMNTFRMDLEAKMKELVVHINDPANDEVVHYVEKLVRRDNLRAQGLDHKKLINEFNASRAIIEKIEKTQAISPEKISLFEKEAEAYFSDLRRAGIKGWLLHPLRQKRNTPFHFFFRILCIIVVSPIYLTGMAFNGIPLFLSYYLTKRFVKLKEFFSSFFFGIAMCVFPIFYGLWFYIFYKLMPNLPAALGCCVLVALTGWATLYIHPFILRTIGLRRFLNNNPEMVRLIGKRAELVEMINKF
jgi:1-acyl-sn-glycerol-3-phosphate acyltransferase